MKNLPFTIYHLPLISHFSFNKCKLIIDNSLPGLRSQSYFGGVGIIENCKLIIASNWKELA